MFKEGDKVPPFSIITDKKEFILKEINTYKTVVFFFTRANTSGGTKEAVEFSHLIEEFKKLNTLIIGISKDGPEQQKKFREKHDLKCELGSDVNGKICEIFSILTLAPGNSLVILLSISFCTPSKLKIIEEACQIKRNIIIDTIPIADANTLKIGKLIFFTKNPNFHTNRLFKLND